MRLILRILMVLAAVAVGWMVIVWPKAEQRSAALREASVAAVDRTARAASAETAPDTEAADPPRYEVAPEPSSRPSPAPKRKAEVQARPSFDCDRARTEAEKTVCGDLELAALDRELNAAFEAAVARGADRRALRAEQDDWLRIRERAAPSERRMAALYRSRIEELEAMGAD